MFGFDLKLIAFVILAALSMAGIAYAFLFTSVENENKRSQRMKSFGGDATVRASSRAAVSRESDRNKRRKNVSDTLKKIEDKQKKNKKKVGVKEMLFQAGLKTTVARYYAYSAISGLVFFILAFLFANSYYVVGGALIIGFLGFPRFILGRMRKKRIKNFTMEFPNAVDVIVRGVKAGLPLNDCIGIVSREAKEPVSTEFRSIIEHQQLGVPMSEAVLKMNESMPTAEANFFGIVVAIQQGAGGNLAEALNNLSGVLRSRKMMEAKIKSMSAEAKASGGIIGSLPIIVGILVYLTTPDYISILFTHPTGNLILACAAMWMGIGIFVMKQMINFDF